MHKILIMGKKQFSYDKSLCKHFGLKVASLRKTKGLPQDEVAFMAQISTSYLSSIERGKTDVTISTVKRIAKALEVDIYELFIFQKNK